ncbi:MAG TPA: cell division protein FtsA [Patescibacteria group bacterium]|nr:cell division protein FtsA [Patescibacteria group bacterium]
MRETNISVGIDIGNTKVVTCVGKLEAGNIDIIGIGNNQNNGVRKGIIVNVEETVSAISSSLEEAERMAGTPIQSAVVSITGPSIECEQSKGVIAISRTDGEITTDDLMRVIDAAKAIPSRPNREILHVIPVNFIIDSTEVVKDPVGMTGIRLEVIANIISASSNSVKSLTRSVQQAGVDIADVVFSPLSTAKVLLSSRQMDIGVILVDIGACTTSYAVFEEGELVTCGVVPIGSTHITNDIAIGLRVNIDLAENIKLKYGYALPDKVDEKEEIDLSKLDKNEEEKVNLKYIAEIIEARLNEVFMLISDNLTRVNCNTSLPGGVIITGGGSKIDGIVELTKNVLRLPAQIGKPVPEISGLIDKLNDPIYSTSIGLMIWGKDRQPSNNSINLDLPGLNSVVSKFKSVFKKILP